ncbi:autotransporter outer membrane beta-barrel domain-containing protein, partial [Moraxella sp.]|uniref:autotransporter outer membrane beta-barrel domain-containing protein n=1 Tax=Moraxella sp. TaxID=479 RepID=UPI0026DDC7E5
MNKSYRVIFNHATGVYQCVAEFAKARGKTKSVKALAVAVGLVMSGASFGADLEFSDGTTTTVETAGINGDVIITNPNTKIIATKQVLFGTSTGSPPKTTNATISNQATVQGTEATALGDSHDATVTVDNATLNSGELLALGIKTNRVAKLIGKNGATIAVAGRTTIGNEVGATGEIELDGANTTLTVTPNTDSISIIRVGENGTGSLIAKNQASITANQVALGDTATSVGTLMLDNASLSSKELVIGALGKGDLTTNKSTINLASTLSVGDNTGSVGVATLSDTNLTATDLIAIGAKGTGTLTFNNTATSYNPASTTKISTSKLIVGQFTGGTGTMTVNGASPLQVTDSMIVGGGGTGTLTINKNSKYTVGHTKAGTVYIGGSNINQVQGGTGTLIIKDSTLVTDEIIVGNTGKGTLRLEANDKDTYLTGLYTKQISRNANSAQSDIFINGAEIGITADQPNLFANFTNANKIELGNKGVTFETNTYDSQGNTIATNVIINPNAVLTGNAGTINFDDPDVGGGFFKYGKGTLEISESSKQFTGDIAITQGILKINGNYTMNGENLLIGILDRDEDGTLDTTSEYGKLQVTGTADIANGHLKVYTDELIANAPQDSVWRDVVTAGTLNGQFASLNDNSPLVDFEADYSDANKVHLKLAVQNNTPTPTPTPTP